MVMLKRTLFFGSPGRLFLEHSLLAYETRNANDASEKRTFPLEDLGFIVLESLQLAVTTACLNALAKENIAVVVCDHAHMPSAMLQPFSGNTLAQRHTEAQLRATEALKARLWRQTVKAKITNQAECLKRLACRIDGCVCWRNRLKRETPTMRKPWLHDIIFSSSPNRKHFPVVGTGFLRIPR